MLTLHHLAYSRSLRVLWLLEELGTEFELVSYDRTSEGRAPPELAKIHPLGKSPVIVDGELVLAESSAILRYIDGKYGSGSLTPPTGTNAHATHDEWLDYVEGSAALPIMISLLGKRAGGLSEGMQAFADRQIKTTLAYIASGIGAGPFLMGEKLTLADIQMSYMLAVAEMSGLLKDQPVISAYLERLKQQPGFQRATERGGPMTPPPKD
jgi:glutathione S-transferase